MIGPAAASSNTNASPSTQANDQVMGRDAFLKLLVTQIQMQDPLEPLKAENFIGQLAQFSSVEQLESANLQLSIMQQAEATSQALLLIGRNIATSEGGISGAVQAVVFEDGQPKLLVDGQQVNPGDVTRVW
jgi:flagellar basal-body rod modification protein FlgD